MAKVLTTMLLLKSQYHFSRYMPIERMLEERQADYFKVLTEGQRHRRRYTEREKISDWIIFFMECIEQAIQKLDAIHHTMVAENKMNTLTAPVSGKPMVPNRIEMVSANPSEGAPEKAVSYTHLTLPTIYTV